jgi:hypothetical protein
LGEGLRYDPNSHEFGYDLEVAEVVRISGAQRIEHGRVIDDKQEHRCPERA